MPVGPREVPIPKTFGDTHNESVRYEENTAGILTKSAINDSLQTSACSNVQISNAHVRHERVFSTPCTRYCIMASQVSITSSHKRCHSMPYQLGLAEEGLLPLRSRLCWKVTGAKDETSDATRARRSFLGFQTLRCGNPHGCNTGAVKTSLKLCVSPGCCKPLWYLEIRNRVWHLFRPLPKSKRRVESGNFSCLEAHSRRVPTGTSDLSDPPEVRVRSQFGGFRPFYYPA